MAARFPQSTTSLGWRIKPAYSSKILAIYWPATADSVHRLYSADTSTTIITRSTSGASINGDGLLTGNVTGAGGSYFSDSKTGGLGTTENGNYTLIASYYGDLFNGVGDVWALGCAAPMDGFLSRQSLKSATYTWDFVRSGNSLGSNNAGGGDDVLGWMVIGIRQVPSDGTARFRAWANGAEITGLRSSTAPSSSATVGDASNALRFGGSATGTGNTRAWPECWIVATDLSVADMDAITADPSVVIEVVTATLTGSITFDNIDPTGTLGLNPSTLGASTLTLDAIAPTGTLGIAPGTVSTLPFSRNTGSRPAGLTGIAVAILSDDANMTRLAGATSLSQDGAGRVIYSGAGLPAFGTSVLVVTREPDGKLGLERYTVQ